MESPEPRKKRLRAVLVVSAVGVVACGNFSGNDSPPESPEGGEGDEVAPAFEPFPVPDTVGLPPRDEWGGAGAGNHEDAPGGAGGENGFVGIPK